jgi:hypothetical protein
MAKSAQQKWNEYLSECEATSDALNSFERAVQAKYDGHGYAYIAGYFMMQFREVVLELPKKRRAEIRERFLREAKKFEQETLLKQIKESA